MQALLDKLNAMECSGHAEAPDTMQELLNFLTPKQRQEFEVHTVYLAAYDPSMALGVLCRSKCRILS